MRVFLYEFLTGGGTLSTVHPDLAGTSLLREGVAMIRAIASDFSHLPEVEVILLRDHRIADSVLPPGVTSFDVGSPKEGAALFVSMVDAADWTLIIAPESNGILINRVREVEAAGGRLLSPDAGFVEVAADKQATAATLARAGVATPRGCLWQAGGPPPVGLRYPVVVKPQYGAGSQGLTLVEHPEAMCEIASSVPVRVEEFHEGIAASISVLCGSTGNYLLAPCHQRLSTDGRFEYLGGTAPLDRSLQARAAMLARSVIAAMPQTSGYVGIDLVLGDSPDEDVVIEVNPRLTTSYCGLRRLAKANLARAMLHVAEGTAPDIDFGHEPVEFAADGTILRVAL